MENQNLSPVAVELDLWDSLVTKQLAFVDFAPGNLRNVWICIDSVRVLSAINRGEESVDLDSFNKGQTFLFPSGTVLGFFALPKGKYRSLEIDLSPDCVGGKSLSFDINEEKFSFQEKIRLTFEGSFTVDRSQTLILEIQEFLAVLRNHPGGGELREQLERVRGAIKTVEEAG